MAQIDASRQLMTLVVAMEIDPERVDVKLDHLREVAHEHSKRPGFVSCSIHRSLDGSRLVEYIQWESPAAHQAVRETFEGDSPHPPGFAIRMEAIPLAVVEVVEPASDG
jgi:Antibiotic biosynthesis monooxygenase